MLIKSDDESALLPLTVLLLQRYSFCQHKNDTAKIVCRLQTYIPSIEPLYILQRTIYTRFAFSLFVESPMTKNVG